GNLTLADRYEAILTGSRGLRVLDLDRSLLRAAAQLRAAVRVTTPDALQLAAALIAGAATYLTNDRDLPRIPGLRILQLRDYLGRG
ncbi:MAG TPA: PIN domain-containing protein, partial [Thermodesulfobacteriota bacterium]